jgi:hypothetical protein
VFRGKRKSAADVLEGVGEIGVGTIESSYQLSPQLISPLAIMVGDPVAPMHRARFNYDVFHGLAPVVDADRGRAVCSTPTIIPAIVFFVERRGMPV